MTNLAHEVLCRAQDTRQDYDPFPKEMDRTFDGCTSPVPDATCMCYQARKEAIILQRQWKGSGTTISKCRKKKV